MTKADVVHQFFEAYSKRDMNKIKEVMVEEAVWYFIGQHKLAGVKKGLEEIICFFDQMGGIMMHSKPLVEKLIVAENDHYFIECQHIQTNREDNININHFVTVLWTIENGKIISGRHFFADPPAVDQYFNVVPQD